ncbi:hypothetical protein V8E53_000162 [Lactarius tabidus]
MFFWDIGRSGNNDACRRTDSSPHADTPFDDLTGSFARIGSKCPKLSHPRCIDTALIFHDPRGRPFKPALAWLTLKWLGPIIQDPGPGGTTTKRTFVHA